MIRVNPFWKILEECVMRIRLAAMTAVVTLLVGVPLMAQTTIGSFTGGDPGEGLDMQGNFVYAVNMLDPGGFSIGDANFTADNASGVDVSANNQVADWIPANFGSSTDDNNLELVMKSIRYSDAPANVVITLSNLNPGTTYKLQMLFEEGCDCNRGFDILVNEQMIADDFAPYTITGVNSTSLGAVVTYQFVAPTDTTTIRLDGTGVTNPSYTDHNPIIQGLTLEQVSAGIPTMGAWSLIAMALGLLAVAAIVQR
jgi:hypothetical protein